MGYGDHGGAGRAAAGRAAWFGYVGFTTTAGPVARTPDEITQALTFVHQTFLHRRHNNIRDDYRLVVVIDESNLGNMT